MTVLSPAPHSWQVGLAEPGGRVCDTLVLPVDCDLTVLLAPLRERWPALAWIPPTGYAHLTLAAVENPARFEPFGSAAPVAWQVEALECTPYSLRARVTADLGSVSAMFGVPARRAYLTLAYALAGVDLSELCSVPFISGTIATVQHRRFETGCLPFALWLSRVGAWLADLSRCDRLRCLTAMLTGRAGQVAADAGSSRTSDRGYGTTFVPVSTR